MAIAAADLQDFIEDILDPRWLFHYELTAENSVTKTQLALAIVAKGV